MPPERQIDIVTNLLECWDRCVQAMLRVETSQPCHLSASVEEMAQARKAMTAAVWFVVRHDDHKTRDSRGVE
jgi:hypothetical protein